MKPGSHVIIDFVTHRVSGTSPTYFQLLCSNELYRIDTHPTSDQQISCILCIDSEVVPLDDWFHVDEAEA